MKSVNPLILVVAAMLNAIATAILNANHVFEGRAWIAWCLYGATALLLAWAGTNAIVTSRREQEKASPPPAITPVHQENKQTVTQNVRVSYEGIAESKELSEIEKKVLEILKRRPNGYFDIEGISSEVSLSKREAWDL